MRIIRVCGFSVTVAAALTLPTSNVQAQWGALFGGGGGQSDHGGHDHGGGGWSGGGGWGDSHWIQHGDHYHHNDNYHDQYNHGYNYNNNYNNNNYQRNYSNYREPTYSSPASTTTISVKSNIAPKVKPKPVVANAMKNKVSHLTQDEFEAARDALQAQTDAARGRLQGDIGQGVNNQAVADLLQEAERVTQNGGTLPADWRSRYEQAITAAGIQAGPNFQKNLDSFAGAASANTMFAQGDFDSDVPSFPSGMVNCILMPVLPADDVCMVRSDCCLVGTGGSGSISVVECSASELVDMPLGDGEPNPDSAIDYVNGANDGVLIINPSENEASINFVLDNTSYDLPADDSRNFTGKDSWEVRFNRGNSKSDARYTIEPGTYVFTPGDNGWDLFRRKIKVSVTNQGQDEFNYVAGDEQIKIEPGETLTHSADYPIFLRFDRGNGEEASKRIIGSNAKLGVAINPQGGAWDLYPTDQVQAANTLVASKSNVGKSSRAALFSNMAKKAGGTGGSRSARLMAMMKSANKASFTPAPIADSELEPAAIPEN